MDNWSAAEIDEVNSQLSIMHYQFYSPRSKIAMRLSIGG
jgi:hypothetical protein